MAKLTPKQKRFVEEYLIDLNATAAATRAGYSPKRASEIGYQLLQKTTVSGAINKAMAERSRRTGINQDRVLLELARIAFADMGKFVDWGPDGITLKYKGDLTEDDTACVQEVSEVEIKGSFGTKTTIKIKLYDKLAALELLGKHLGMFKDKVDVNVDVNLADILKKAWEENRGANKC